MCGIVGVAYHDESRPGCDLTEALAAIRHRGPDDSGAFADGSFAMGMTRLSIIDLAQGDQPMSDTRGRYWIVFNGEIYNYKALRSELASAGYDFQTHSDTEVILAGYIHWGKAVLERLNGMFGFAIWDRHERRVWLARDRLGIKPLYYTQAGGAFRFASEIKALLHDPDVPRAISTSGLANYLTYGHAVAQETMYAGIYKLPPAHYLTYHRGNISIERYWQVPKPAESPLANCEDGIQQIRDLITDAVRLHMVADVPVGAFLSGGLDSASVVSRMVQDGRSVKTFSLGFDDPKHNELSAARRVADHFGTEHYEIMLHHEDLPAILEKLVYHYDEPFGGASNFPTYVVSTLARQHVKVVLTGDGGDELFGGYHRYRAEHWFPTVRRVPRLLRRAGLKFVERMPRQHRLKRILDVTLLDDPAERYARWQTVFWPNTRHAILHPDYREDAYDAVSMYRPYYAQSQGADAASRAMYADLHRWLPESYLEKVDKASMAASVEARVPLLDYRLVELAQRLPIGTKVTKRQNKILFRNAVAEWIPEEILALPKHGFSVPTRSWFKGELSEFLWDVLMDPKAKQRGVFRPKVIEQLWLDHQNGRGVYDTHLWLLLNFELWARRYLDPA